MTRPQPFDDAQTLAVLRWRISTGQVIVASLRLMAALERRANYDPAQPRDDLGRWSDGGGSSSTRIADQVGTKPTRNGRVRVAGPFDWGPIDLRYEEDFKNGHAMKLHVGMTDDQLAVQAVARLSTAMVRKKGEARAGTFDTIESANVFVNAAIASDEAGVHNVSSGATRIYPIYAELGRATGREVVISAKDGKISTRKTTGLCVFLIHDPGRLRGFRVHTAYPMNFD